MAAGETSACCQGASKSILVACRAAQPGFGAAPRLAGCMADGRRSCESPCVVSCLEVGEASPQKSGRAGVGGNVAPASPVVAPVATPGPGRCAREPSLP